MSYFRMDRIITIQTPTASQDDFGGEVITWSNEDIPAAIETGLNKSESMGKSLKEIGLTTITFTTRYRSNINEKQQIIFESNVYDILGITEVERRDYTKITATLKR